MKFSLKAVLESILIGLISALLAVVLFFIPILNMAVLLFPVPLIIVGVRKGIWAGVLALVVSSALLGIIINPFLGLMVFVLNVFSVVGLSWAFKRRMQTNECIVLSAASILASILAAFQAFSWIVGQNFFDFLWASLKKFFIANPDSTAAVIELYERLGILEKGYSIEEFAQLLIGQMMELMPLVPSALLIFSVTLGTGIFLLSRWVLKKFRFSVPYVPQFKDWALPKGTGQGFLVIMLIAVIRMFMGIQNFDVVFYTISALFSFVFAVQGLATIAFFLNVGKLPPVVQILIIIAAFIFASAVLTFIGVFEQIFGFRRAYSSRL